MRKFTVYPSNYVKANRTIQANALNKYAPIRKLLGEKEWYYIEEYLINGDKQHSLQDILFDEGAWDDYCDWKMENYHQKAALSASTRLRAQKCFTVITASM